jgi:membrane-associated progesterone receptor component
VRFVKFEPAMNMADDGKRIFTPKELEKYNGSDPSLPLLLAIKGQVFDVSKNSKMYTEGAYGVFLGKDASNALGKSSTSIADCYSDYSQLNEEEVSSAL